jgi:hypothetical protein
MAKKEDYDTKEPGQQFGEIEEAQRQLRQRKHGQQGDDDVDSAGKPKPIIDSIEKSKQRDNEELKQLGDEALEKLGQRKAIQGEQ